MLSQLKSDLKIEVWCEGDSRYYKLKEGTIGDYQIDTPINQLLMYRKELMERRLSRRIQQTHRILSWTKLVIQIVRGRLSRRMQQTHHILSATKQVIQDICDRLSASGRVFPYFSIAKVKSFTIL
jgi:hypothetical protein